MPQREHISYSEWMSFLGCEWRWLKDYYEEKRAPVYSVYMTFGTAIHYALEKYKDPEAETKYSIDELCSLFAEKFESAYLKIRDKDKRTLSDAEIAKFVEAGKVIINNLHTCKELSEAKVLFVEYPLIEKIERTDDVNIKFKGFIDLVIKTKDKRGKSIVYICDYKTCSWGWDREKRTDEDLQAQLRLYKHFFSKKFNLDPKNVKTAFILCKRSPKDLSNVVEWLPFSSGDKTTMRAVLRLNEAVTGMQTNNYKKNRNMCKNQYGDVCPYFGTSDCTED